MLDFLINKTKDKNLIKNQEKNKLNRKNELREQVLTGQTLESIISSGQFSEKGGDVIEFLASEENYQKEDSDIDILKSYMEKRFERMWDSLELKIDMLARDHRAEINPKNQTKPLDNKFTFKIQPLNFKLNETEIEGFPFGNELLKKEDNPSHNDKNGYIVSIDGGVESIDEVDLIETFRRGMNPSVTHLFNNGFIIKSGVEVFDFRERVSIASDYSSDFHCQGYQFDSLAKLKSFENNNPEKKSSVAVDNFYQDIPNDLKKIEISSLNKRLKERNELQKKIGNKSLYNHNESKIIKTNNILKKNN